MSAIINIHQKGGTMIQKTSGRQKILEMIFFVFCLLVVGVGVGRASDFTWSSHSVGDKNVAPGITEQLILKLEAENKSLSDIYTVNKITATFCGNPNNAPHIEVYTVNIWVDNDSTFDSSSVCKDTQTFSSSSPATVCFSPNFPIASNTKGYFFITYDLKISVTDLPTVDVQVISTAHIEATKSMSDDPVIVFSGGALLNSSGVDTIIVTATDYTVDTISDQIAGKPFGVKIKMVDGDGNLDLDYTGSTISITGAVGFAPTPAPDGTNPSYPPPEFWQGLSDRGEKILTVVLYKKETGRKLEVTDNVFPPSTDSNSFNIDAGIKFNLSFPQNIPVRKSADIRIDVCELYQNDFTYGGTAHFTSTDNQATLPGNYTFGVGETGKLFTNGITFRTVAHHTVTLTDTIVSNISGTQTVIVQSENAGYRSINYPNPFDSHQGTTTIQFYMNGEGKAEIKIYTLTGNLVNEWDIEAQAGINTAFQWDGRDKDGNMVANGTYLCRIKTDIKKETIKISIIK